MHLKQLRFVFVGLFLVGSSVVFLVLMDKWRNPLAAAQPPLPMHRVSEKQAGFPLVGGRILKKHHTMEGGRSGNLYRLESDGGVGATASVATTTEAREQAVSAWEGLVDQIVETAEPPLIQQADEMRVAFDRLDGADKLSSIRLSLNRFQDDRICVLYGILFDRTQDREVVDAIFNDILNRSEEIKEPILKELVKDEEHPCFKQAARILEATGW